jgi:hypothetical protein
MKLRIRDFLLMALIAPAIALAEDTRPQDTEKLLCDSAIVIAHSNCLRFAEQERQCKTQTLELRNVSRGAHATLQHAGKLIRQPFVRDGRVLDAIASSWACINSPSGISYVYVLYTCVENGNSPECAGANKEWEMIYGTDGKNLTPAIPRRGTARAKALARVYRRLGLESVMEKPVQLQGIKY